MMGDGDWVSALGGEGSRDWRKVRSSASASSSRVGAFVIGGGDVRGTGCSDVSGNGVVDGDSSKVVGGSSG